jgi:acetyl-CoA carboxylase biotin carboxyl carrier protein
VSETVDQRRLTELRSLLQVIEDAGWAYARVEIDGVTLVVSSDPDFAAADAADGAAASVAAAPAPTTAAPVPPAPATPAPTPPATPAEVPADHSGPAETVTAPTIGLFWRSPKPGAPPFVEIGDTVQAGDTVCIIEVMKLMTHVTAPVAGTVTAIHIANGSMVEHGTALVDVTPADIESAS